MTLDDLMQIFDKAYCLNLEKYESKISSERAGIRAVVTALRETFGLAYSEGRMSMVRGSNENHQRQWVDALINEILASDAGEKVAGGSTREDEKAVEAAGDKGPVSVNSPATDAAPAVCVWECGTVPDKKGLVRVTSKCAGFESVRSELVIGRASHNCPSCGKPIIFKEPSHE